MTDVETKRGRVRRLLITPLEEPYSGMGFTFPREVSAEKARGYLDWLADWMGYLSDDELRLLRETLSTKGEGSRKRFWPQRATVVWYAQGCRPRPLETWPESSSWFSSIEGPRARVEGTMVATFQFIEKNVRPPYTTKDRARVKADASDLNAEVERAREFDACGRLDADGRAYLAWHDDLVARAEALVAAGEAKRGEAA